MAPGEGTWTAAHDDALRDALDDVLAEAGAVTLDPPDTVRNAGRSRRRRRTVSWAVAAVVALLAAVGVGVLVTPDGSPRPPATPPGPTASPTTSPTVSPEPTDTDVIGEGGALGPFRLGMTEAEVTEVLATDYPDGSVRLEDQVFGGGFEMRVVVQDGADTGIAGDTPGTGVVGIFDAADRDGAGVLDALVAPSTARVRGLGVGASVTAFERAFPGRVTTDDASTVYLLDLADGVRLQLGRPSAYLDPSTVDFIVILPAGAPAFSDFPYLS